MSFRSVITRKVALTSLEANVSQPILEMMKIIITYPNGVISNNKANLCVNRGEIDSIVKENGAVKTTLMKILFGLETAVSGETQVFSCSKTKEKDAPQNKSGARTLRSSALRHHFSLKLPESRCFDPLAILDRCSWLIVRTVDRRNRSYFAGPTPDTDSQMKSNF